jgi:hypothetical protein
MTGSVQMITPPNGLNGRFSASRENQTSLFGQPLPFN